MQKTRRSKPAAAGSSPVQAVGRKIQERTAILLAAHSAGRCQFRGCNKYLFAHPITLQKGNFSQQAHIVAFSEQGPRGGDEQRPIDINSVDNLMLLCAECHKLIDDNPTQYPRELLIGHKHEHEERVRTVTGLGPEMRTSVVQLKSRIAGDAVDIPATDIYGAIAPRYPVDERGTIIDLTQFQEDSADEYYRLAAREIQSRAKQLYQSGMSVDSTKHISLFAIAQIPLLVLLGRSLSNKIPVDLYQRHRDQGNPWQWPEDSDPVTYRVEKICEGASSKEAALILSLSGSNPLDALPAEIRDACPVYELTLENRQPAPDFLRKREDLQAFRRTYREFLANLLKYQPSVELLHLFPACPAPIAVACGHDLLPKVHPALLVYDRDRRSGGFVRRINVNENERN
jgi:hypothetical protein